jgi:exopolyphosphatase / guanosine-5'-triphosphate,3'-diphosphate pyrophosphatase
VRVAVLDVGSNTLRLLVAHPAAGGVQVVHTDKAALALGADVEEHGYVTSAKVRSLVEAVTAYRRRAQELQCAAVEVLVASPGRQAGNAADVVAALQRTSGAPVRVLSAEEEAVLAYDGAIATLERVPETVGVVDVGGGSTQLVVGHRDSGPAWARSVDLGSLRLARRLLRDDPPGYVALAAAMQEAARCFNGIAPPLPRAGLIVGGTARNRARIVGPALGEEQLDHALELLGRTRRRVLVKRFGVSPERARTLAAGAVIVAEARRRLAVEFELARAGLREGAVLALAREAAAA